MATVKKTSKTTAKKPFDRKVLDKQISETAKYPLHSVATPLLDAAVVSNPHKTIAGWNSAAAKELAAEFGKHISATMTLQDTAILWKRYVPFTGHKNLARTFLAVCGEVAPDARD